MVYEIATGNGELASFSPNENLADGEAARRAQEHAKLVQDVAAIRASLTGLSPVLVAACADEGLPVAAVVYALMPLTAWPGPDEGWPWRSTVTSSARDLPARGQVVRTSKANKLRNQFFGRNRWCGTFIRSCDRPEGAWAASLYRGVVGVEIHRSSAVVRTVGKRGALRIATQLADSVATAAKGRRIAELVASPLFVDPAMVITSVSVKAGSTLIRFHCPPIQADLALLTSAPCSVQLGRDPTLVGEAALTDLLAREIACSGDRDPDYLLARLRERLNSLDLARPPGVPKLPEPSAQ